MNRQPRRGRKSRTPSAGAGALIEVHVDALAPGGDAVGRQQGGQAAGRATFVALAAPGETIQARLVREKSRVAWAELVGITQASAQRVKPPCPLFGRCGGCQWQHVELPAQRAAKREIVARALGLPHVPLVVPVDDGQGYRDRAQLVVGPKGEVGFRARRSHDVVDVIRCLLLSPPLAAALAAIRASAPLLSPATEIDLQAGREGVLVALRLPGSDRARLLGEGKETFTRLWNDWRPSGVVGLRVVAAAEQLFLGSVDVDISGDARGELPFRVPAGAFAQVGQAANQALVAAVLREVGPDPGVVLELYAGSGNFTRGLNMRATRVMASDADGAAVERGRKNVPGATWVGRPPTVADADTVLVDPPREGLDAENLAAVRQARRRIVYVSCDPQTLGRDATRLKEAGFVLGGALALDLMPHTFHVEVVATFERR